MKVLLLSDNPAFGGTSRYCMNLALGLRQLGVDLTILAPYRTDRPQDDWLLQEARKHGIPVQTLIRQGALDWKSVVALKRILLEGQFEIVHSQGYLSNVLARLAIKLGRTRTKSVITLHAWGVDSQTPPRTLLYNKFDVLTTPWTAHAIAVDTTARDDYQKQGVPARMITVIPNGVLTYEDQDLPKGERSGRFVVGFVGRMSEEKGVDELVAIAQRVLPAHPDIEFLLVGDGPGKPQLEALQSQPYGQQLTLTGRVYDVTPYYARMDVLIMPSHREGMPFTALEAMAQHVPLIASAVGGLPGLITQEKNGILFPVQDVDAAVSWIVRLKENPALCRALGDQAARTVEAQYSARVMSQRTLEVYQNVLAAR